MVSDATRRMAETLGAEFVEKSASALSNAPSDAAADIWRDAYVAVYGCEPSHPPEDYRGAHDVITAALDKVRDEAVASGRVWALTEALAICREMQEQTQFSDEVTDEYRRGFKNAAEACWSYINMLQGDTMRRQGVLWCPPADPSPVRAAILASKSNG